MSQRTPRNVLLVGIVAALFVVGCGLVPIPGTDIGQFLAQFRAQDFIHDPNATLLSAKRGTIGDYWRGPSNEYQPGQAAYEFHFKLSEPSAGGPLPGIQASGSAPGPQFNYADVVVAGPDGTVLTSAACPGLPCNVTPASVSVGTPGPTPGPLFASPSPSPSPSPSVSPTPNS